MAPDWPEGIAPFADYREARPFVYDPPEDGPHILHESEHVLGVDKPAGLLSVPGKTHTDSAMERLRPHTRGVRPVHRLDAATSGVMLFARTHRGQSKVGRQFERRRVGKRYVALVAGRVSGVGEIDLPLRHDVERRPMQCVCERHGKPSVTLWEAVETGAVSRLVLTPLTGRSHQLRAHMLAMGHPILGDRLYAPDRVFAQSPRLMLHAEALTFRPPDGDTPITLEAPCPF